MCVAVTLSSVTRDCVQVGGCAAGAAEPAHRQGVRPSRVHALHSARQSGVRRGACAERASEPASVLDVALRAALGAAAGAAAGARKRLLVESYGGH